jgi:competence protein ComEC
MFTGDAERDTEQAILAGDSELKSTVLKVGHHGSAAATTYPFLREVMPEYAVISVGENNTYGHPHEEALSRLEDADVKIYRTDLHGTVVCTSDGTSVTFTTEKKFSNISTEGTDRTNEVEAEFVLNTKSRVFHTPYCSGVARMSDINKEIFMGTRDEAIDMGYSPCGSCKP